MGYSNFLIRVNEQIEFITPYLLIGLLASLASFLKKHFLKEEFCAVKLVTGLLLDLFFAYGKPWLYKKLSR